MPQKPFITFPLALGSFPGLALQNVKPSGTANQLLCVVDYYTGQTLSTLNSMQASVTTLSGMPEQCSIGIYNNEKNKLYAFDDGAFGAIDANATGGRDTLAALTPQFLPPGRYFECWACTESSIGNPFRMLGVLANLLTAQLANVNGSDPLAVVASNMMVGGKLPDTLGTLSLPGTQEVSVPIVFLRQE